MEEFLIGTGIALLLVLVGWSEQIKSLHKDTIEIEKSFSKERNIEWSQVRKIIRKDVEITKKFIALNKLLREELVTENGDLTIITRFCNLENKRNDLEKLFNIKYTLILILTLLFLISGFVNLFIGSCSKIVIFGLNIPSEYISVFICIFFSLGTLCFVTYLNQKDADYRKDFLEVLDQI